MMIAHHECGGVGVTVLVIKIDDSGLTVQTGGIGNPPAQSLDLLGDDDIINSFSIHPAGLKQLQKHLRSKGD